MLGKRIEYPTMNSWNNEWGPAYNLKIHNVIKRELRSKCYEILENENLRDTVYDTIECLINNFQLENKGYAAGFNGRNNGYLVLYEYDAGKCYGRGINAKDVDGKVLRNFRRLALDIIATAESYAKEEIVDEEYTITKTRKTFKGA